MPPVVDLSTLTPASIALFLALAAVLGAAFWRWGDRATPFVFGFVSCGAAIANATDGFPIVGVVCGMVSGACLVRGFSQVRAARRALDRAALRKARP